MLKRRIFWIAAVVFFAILFVFGNDAGTLTLLLSAILIPAADILFSVIGAGKLYVKASLPKRCEKDSELKITLTVTNDGLFPVTSVLPATLTNLLTGESFELSVKLFAAPKRESSAVITVKPKYCGKIVVRCGEHIAGGCLGLAELKRGKAFEVMTLVYPKLFTCEPKLAENAYSTPESCEYSMERPGGDPSETFAVREYVPGDPIKSIHWKLSEKAGKPMVRELSLPVSDSVLLIFDPFSNAVNNPELTDAAFESLASISAALVRAGVKHTLGRYDSHGVAETWDITDETTYSAAITAFLTQCVSDCGEKAAVTPKLTFKVSFVHILVISVSGILDASGFGVGSRVTLAYPADSEPIISGNGVFTLAFTASDYRNELSAPLF